MLPSAWASRARGGAFLEVAALDIRRPLGGDRRRGLVDHGGHLGHRAHARAHAVHAVDATGHRLRQRPHRPGGAVVEDEDVGHVARMITVKDRILAFWRFIRFVVRRWNQDHCPQMAGSLAFTRSSDRCRCSPSSGAAVPRALLRAAAGAIKIFLLLNLMPEIAGDHTSTGGFARTPCAYRSADGAVA